MRKLLSFAVVLVALAGSRATPVPKDAPAIDGKYNLLLVSTPEDRAGPNGPGGLAPGGFGGPGAFGPGGGGGGWGVPGGWATNSSYMVGPATITKNEITFEGSGFRNGPLGVAGPTTMEYTLDTTKTPMIIDVDNVSVRGKKTKSLGLVEVKGDRLIIALAKEGGERPKTTEEAEGVTVYYLKKAPPPLRTEYRIVAMTVGKEEEAEKELNKLAAAGYELVNTTQPAAADAKASPTTIHFVLRRTVR